ncbi:alpha/beta fold hydrolase [Amycolatopsis sp. GM8]|uniref:alpha/beta fold hydrolase n=1 Tax=Amycolatopsis sp. GM8 TaxID=2896530 RepID=UPI001F33FC79|nr:alpha/beta hydrolase [Amycolatopsis sp. GM8]
MAEFLDINGGRIAFEVTGTGPLVVLSHGIGDLRQAFRFVVPELVRAGFRVAAADLRGHGESSMGDWKSISRTDVAGDLVALVRHLGGPAVIVGHSLSGGAATIAAANAPDLIDGIVEIGPFTRPPTYSLGGLLRNRGYRRATLAMTAVLMMRSLRQWMRYLDVAYPQKPADYDAYMAALRAKLSEPGRMAEFVKTMKTSGADAGAALPRVACPVLVIMGTEDPDWPNPRAEAEALVAAMPAGLGTVEMIDGAGHYPHAQCPGTVAELITDFLRKLRE